MDTLNKYCIHPHLSDSNSSGVCYYDYDGNWISINANTRQELRNTIRFIYDNEGKLIPLRNRRIVKDNVRTVRVPPNLLTTFYSDFACTHIIGTVAGMGLKQLGINADKYGIADVPAGTVCITVSDEYYPFEDSKFSGNCNNCQKKVVDSTLNNVKETDSISTQISNNTTNVTSGEASLLWLQILGSILIAISLILVGIAYYQFWKRNQKNIKTTQKVENKPMRQQTNIYGSNNYPQYLDKYREQPPLVPTRPISTYISTTPQVQFEGYTQVPNISITPSGDTILSSGKVIPKVSPNVGLPQVEQSSMVNQVMDLPTTF